MREGSSAFYFTLGFVYVCLSIPKTSTVNLPVRCGDLSEIKEQCDNTKVHGFTCIMKYTKTEPKYICEWTAGEDNSTSYTLCTQQRRCSCVKVNKKNRILTSNGIYVIDGYNLKASVIATKENQSCYKNFSGDPTQLKQCGPPSKVTFIRSSGHLSVQADWGDEEKYIKQFSVKYREFNATGWKEQLCEKTECAMRNLTTSLSYEMQIHCNPTAHCSQCPLSEVITVPQELTDTPSVQHEIEDHLILGQRRVTVKWEFPNSEAVTDYSVTVRKATGEPCNQNTFITKTPSLILVLSYSAYNINIIAHNSAGSSPAAKLALEHMDDGRDLGLGFGFGLLNVSITSNSSFSLSWSSSVSSVCYSVEWWAKGQIPAFQSFYVKEPHTEITESNFQPYVRYYFLLHIRPDIDTCNMKNVNNSERTYGTAQAYLTEGSPFSAPGNVSILNITQHSSVILWSRVSEEDLRGFLLGYIIYYTDDTLQKNETRITVDPSVNSYELLNLKSMSAYRVQLSAFTAAGEGERSDPKPFVTDQSASPALNVIIAVVVVVMIILLIAVHLSCRLLHRVKKLLWPSIPNPGNSNAVQKIEIGYELVALEPLNRQRLEESEECDSSTVCFIESKREVSPLPSPHISQAGLKPTVFPQREGDASTSTFEETTSPETPTLTPTREPRTEIFPMKLNKRDSVFSASIENEDPGDSNSNMRGTNSPAASVKPATLFMSDYTTMEFFQQVAMAGIQSPSNQTGKPGIVPVHSGQAYVRQSLCFAENEQPCNLTYNATDVLPMDITVL